MVQTDDVLALQVVVSPVATIYAAAHQAMGVALTLGVVVEFNFNGVRCVADRRGKAETLIANYEREIDRRSPAEIAWSF